MMKDGNAASAAPTWNHTGLSWHIDVNVIDAPDAIDLLRMGGLGWINLHVTDTAWVEVGKKEDPEERARLQGCLRPFAISMGPMVLGHGALGLTVTGSDEDVARIHKIHALIWPRANYDRDAASASGNGRNRFRDALHVATTIRYNSTAFVTQDLHLQQANGVIRENFDQRVNIWSVAEATTRAMKAITNTRLTALNPRSPVDPSTLPHWPPTGEQ